MSMWKAVVRMRIYLVLIALGIASSQELGSPGRVVFPSRTWVRSPSPTSTPTTTTTKTTTPKPSSTTATATTTRRPSPTSTTTTTTIPATTTAPPTTRTPTRTTPAPTKSLIAYVKNSNATDQLYMNPNDLRIYFRSTPSHFITYSALKDAWGMPLFMTSIHLQTKSKNNNADNNNTTATTTLFFDQFHFDYSMELLTKIYAQGTLFLFQWSNKSKTSLTCSIKVQDSTGILQFELPNITVIKPSNTTIPKSSYYSSNTTFFNANSTSTFRIQEGGNSPQENSNNNVYIQILVDQKKSTSASWLTDSTSVIPWEMGNGLYVFPYPTQNAPKNKKWSKAYGEQVAFHLDQTCLILKAMSQQQGGLKDLCKKVNDTIFSLSNQSQELNNSIIEVLHACQLIKEAFMKSCPGYAIQLQAASSNNNGWLDKIQQVAEKIDWTNPVIRVIVEALAPRILLPILEPQLPSNSPPLFDLPVPTPPSCDTIYTPINDFYQQTIINLRNRRGTIVLNYSTFNIADLIEVEYEGKIILSTGCVTVRNQATSFSYNGVSTSIKVKITPNCAGNSNGIRTQYEWKLEKCTSNIHWDCRSDPDLCQCTDGANLWDSVKKRFSEPTINSCGPDGQKFLGWMSDWVSLGGWGMGFRGCCALHDQCYGTCNTRKDGCDDSLEYCLQRICDEFQAPEPWRTIEVGMCKTQALSYWPAVKYLGYTAFKKGQDDSCECKEQK